MPRTFIESFKSLSTLAESLKTKGSGVHNLHTLLWSKLLGVVSHTFPVVPPLTLSLAKLEALWKQEARLKVPQH